MSPGAGAERPAEWKVRGARSLPPRLVGVVTVGTGVLLLSPDSLWVRIVSKDAWTTLFWRGAAMAVGFCVLWWLSWRTVPRSPRLTLPTGLAIVALTTVGNVCFVGTISHAPAAQSLVILSSSPLLAALITSALGIERVRPRTWLAVAVVVPCITALVAQPGTTAVSVGDAYALVGALALASLLVVVRHAGDANTIGALAIAGAATAAIAAPSAHIFTLGATGALAAVAGFAIMFPLAFSLILRGPRYLAAPEVALIMLLETVLGPVWIWLALGERPTTRVLLAGAVILATLVASSIAELRRLPADEGPDGRR